jgi:diguanylate cyclase
VSVDDVVVAPEPVATARAPTWARRLLMLLVAVTGVYVAWLVLSPGEYQVIRDVGLSGALVLSCSGLVLVRSRSLPQRERAGWVLIAAGLAVWSVADIGYSAVVSRGAVVPYPAWSDWLYLCFYPLAYAGVVIIYRARYTGRGRAVWLDGLLAALGFAAIVWVTIPGIYGSMGADSAAVFMSFAGPVADVLLLCLLAGIVGVLGLRAERTWWLLLAGALVLWAADSAWLLGVGDHSYSVGALLDACWPMAFLLLVVAAWQSPPRSPWDDSQAASPVSVIPVIVPAACFVLLLAATEWPLPQMSVALAAAAIIVGLWRTALMAREASVQAELRRQAYLDDLTGLPNRRRLMLELQHQAPGFALLLMDIDGFKEINDSLGHAAGDEVLKAIAPRLRSQLRSIDTVARLGGDEFAILLVGTATIEDAVRVAAKLRAELSRPIPIGDLRLQIDVSTGIAVSPCHGGTIEELLRAADSAMYRAKHAKTGQAVFDGAIDTNHSGHLLFLQQLRTALARGELGCVYQPKVDLVTGAVTGVEALVRWEHPERGQLAPGAFVPFAEQTALIRPLTDMVLELAVGQVAEWREQGIDVVVGVNLSTTNLLDPELPETVRRLLESAGVAPANLILEVTESMFMADPGRARDVIAELGRLGVILSIDDYGTGFSSLTQVRTLQAGEIKLDASFVTGVAGRKDLRSVVRSTAMLAHGLGVELVAEGIESAADLRAVRELGCDQGQGYFICPPLPPLEVTAWLRSRATLPRQRSNPPRAAVTSE